MFESICRYIQDLYNSNQVPLHAPIFSERDKVMVNECIDSTFVSSVGAFVGQFEKMVATYTGAQFAIATVNGTSALHIALLLAGVEKDTEVLTQSLTFVATANAILYTGAHPVFLDSADNNLGMCPRDLKEFCLREIEMRGGIPYNRKTGKRIAACLPMHVFGHPALVNEIDEVCSEFRIPLIEDAAESLGSFLTSGPSSKHTGNIGKLSILSFNGNKIITCGGGGMIITNDALLA
ncbi:MAG TPA: DegT/DnrJ/EryC1/StrS family aminotransferase, partial [Pseudobdellovibrionaceae bacterium]|nr:DegT/DnrJ/EryC1/StrS family aminotransferase [Pseudobdellovibrionaceae bacterium]